MNIGKVRPCSSPLTESFSFTKKVYQGFKTLMGIGRIELVSSMAEGKKEGLGKAAEIGHLKKKVCF